MRGATVLVVVAIGLIAVTSMADRTTVVYAPTDGGSVRLPALSARKAFEMTNNYTVAICVAAGTTAAPSAGCTPMLPGEKKSMDVSDSHPFAFRLCAGATVASCLGDGGVTILEIQ